MSYNNNIFDDLEERYSSNTVRLLADQKKRDILTDKVTKTKIPNNKNVPLPNYPDYYNDIFGNVIEERNKYNYAKNILTHTDDAPSFLITGCQGASYIVGNQSRVAKAMRDFCINNPDNNRKGILLGDNFYNSGVTYENDTLFENHFYKMYKGLNFPFFNILGNHDYDFHGRSSKTIHPMQRAMAQVNHTYIDNPVFQRERDERALPEWIMPARYYALSYNNANFFMLDSSTFCFDAEQRSWLEKTYKILNPEGSKKWNILVMHHPLVSYGKRHPSAKKSDIDFYLLPEYGNIEIPDATMNQWIFEVISSMDINFDLELCAHDHFLGFSEIKGSSYSNKNSYSPYEVKQQQEKMHWNNLHNATGLSGSPDFIPTNYDDALTFNPTQKLPYKNMIAKPKMYQALVGGGGAFPTGLERKDLAIWTEENFGFLDLKIGENVINLNYHHTGRFWNSWTKKKLHISKDDATNTRELKHF